MEIITLEKYVIGNGLTDRSIWRWDKRYANNAKIPNRMVRNLLVSKLLSRGGNYRFRVRVLRNIAETYLLGKDNWNTLWTANIERKAKIIRDNLSCFHFSKEDEITDQHQKIPLIWTLVVKFYRFHRTNICARVNRTSDLEIYYYSGVVEFETIWTLFLISVLKWLSVIAADVASS